MKMDGMGTKIIDAYSLWHVGRLSFDILAAGTTAPTQRGTVMRISCWGGSSWFGPAGDSFLAHIIWRKKKKEAQFLPPMVGRIYSTLRGNLS